MHRLIAIFALLALAGWPNPGSLVAQSEPGVTLYRDAGFRGPNLTFYDGAELAELRGLAIGNDAVSSVRVERPCRVTLYEHADFRGRATTLTEDAVDLYGTEVGDDQVSSFKVECRRPAWPEGGQGAGRGVVLYADENYRGREEVFFNDDPSLDDNYIRSDTADSVRVGQGCSVVLFEHADFRGDSVTLTEDIADLRLTRLGNDRVSSLKVECKSPGGFAGAPSGDRRGVVLYADGDYRGQAETFYAADRSLGDNAIGSDTANSVRLDEGCRVTLYEHDNFRGESVTLTDDVPDLRLTRLGANRASSLEVFCEPEPGSPAGGEGAVTLYADDGYYGRSETFDRDDPDLRDNPIGQDTVSSVRVAPGCRVILYRDIDYRGTSTLLTEDTASMRTTAVGNDQVSSLEVFCDRRPEGVTLYEHRDYEGRSETFLEDDPQLDNNAFPNDAASSVRVAPGCTVTLYQHANYDGRSTTLREDAPDLRVTSVGNDTVSSLRVECERRRWR